MGQCSGCFSVQSCQGRSEWPCCHGCLPPHPLSPSYRWVLGSHCGAGPRHCCCLPCHGWAVCCQGALAWLKLPTVPVEGAPRSRPFNQKPAIEKGQQVSTVPLTRAPLLGAQPRASALGLLLGHRARQSPWQGTTQSCSCWELALGPLTKKSCSAVTHSHADKL